MIYHYAAALKAASVQSAQPGFQFSELSRYYSRSHASTAMIGFLIISFHDFSEIRRHVTLQRRKQVLMARRICLRALVWRVVGRFA